MTSDAAVSSSVTITAAQNLRVDAVTVEVVDMFRREGVESILLKGPSLGHWLGSAVVRPYLDTDLLVEPDSIAVAERVLVSLGFERYLASVDMTDRWRHPAWAWKRRSDGTYVDFHHGIAGVGAPDTELWTVLASHRDRMRLGRLEVAILDPAGTAMVAALHAAQHGITAGKPLADLSAALDRLPEAAWYTARHIAAELDAIPAFAAGLRLVPAGCEVAEELELPTHRPLDIVLTGSSTPHAARTLADLAAQPGLQGKAAFVRRWSFPPPPWMRSSYPLARRGRTGLVAAYAWRAVVVPIRLVRALPIWLRARREGG